MMFFSVTVVVIANVAWWMQASLFRPNSPVEVAFMEALKMKFFIRADGVCLHFCLSFCLFCPRIRCLK